MMRMTIKKKALFVVIPVLVVVSLVHTGISIKREQALVRSEIQKRAETITTLATKTGELPILSGNPELIKGTVAFLKGNAEVSSVTFYDAAKKELIHDGALVSEGIAAVSADSSISKFEEPDQFVYFAPVFTERTQGEMDILQDPEQVTKVRETIGWIRLGFSKASMQKHEERILIQGIFLALAFSLGSSVLVYFLISLATRPLTRIVSVAEAVAHGDLDQELDVSHGDEIATLAAAFTSMRNTIQQVLRETETLIVAVRGGRLETRTDAEPFEGEWRKLVVGVNQLTDAFAKAHDELKEAKDAAEAANRSKSDFLANMSHELRTPLNAILGYAQILGRQENLAGEQARQVAVMRSSAEHLLSLINDILDVGKIEADRMDLEALPFNLPHLMQQVLNISGINAEEKGLQFTYEAVGPLPDFLTGDERKLRQILLNLLSNAVKYTPEGSVTLRTGYENGRGLFWCEVIDTGIGISKDRHESIFEPFIQLATSRRVVEGTGLGLTITKRLSGLMGGSVTVESEQGKGSIFRVELPLPVAALSATAPCDAAAASTVGSGGGPVRAVVPAKGGAPTADPDALYDAPPKEALEELHRLALLGDMRRIAAFAARLEEGGAHASFVAALSRLARSFKTKAIVEMVERHLPSGAVNR